VICLIVSVCADHCWALPLCAGDYDCVAEPSPIGFHNHVFPPQRAPFTKVLGADVDKDISAMFKTGLADNTIACIESEVRPFKFCIIFHGSVHVCF
jgi:hypothetical protein